MSNSDPAQGGARILVGVDGSDDGLRAALYAMREARAAGSSLWLVNVADDSGLVVNGLWDLLETPAQLSEIGERILAETVGVLVKAGFPAERIATEVVVGSATDALADLSGRAALAVVGRRAMSGLERMFVGSTSVGLAAGAACPVVVISAAATPNRTGHFGTVAVAVSGWPPHSAALDWAVREAAVRKATLLVVHAIPETADAVGRFAEISDNLERHVAALREQHPGTSIETRVLEGSPIDELVAVSDEADLLIVGLHSAGPLSGLVRGLMAHAHCPVGLVR
jgi:nucleotide-binding universal stress UspA family protein